MITSFIFAIAGYALLAIVSILDKFILSGSVKKITVYTFYSTIFFLATFLILPFCQAVSVGDLWWMVGSGLAYGFGLWAMFIALGDGEASHIMPFVGAVVAIATYGLSLAILGEVLSSSVQVGLWLLVISCLLLSFEKSEKHNGFHKGFLWAIFSGILFGVSSVFAKYIYGVYPFITGLVWTKGTVGIVGLIALFIPGTWKEINRLRHEPKSDEKNGLSVVFTSKFLGIIAVILVQYAIALGSVTIVNALAGVEYVLMFIFIYMMTKFKPKIFSEYFTRRELLVESSAIVLTVIGLLFLK